MTKVSWMLIMRTGIYLYIRHSYFQSKAENVSNWNVRKSAAASLDSLCLTYQGTVLQYILQSVQALFQPDKPWRCNSDISAKLTYLLVLESGILALGAIAEGCCAELQPHLESIMSCVVSQLGNPQVFYPLSVKPKYA